MRLRRILWNPWQSNRSFEVLCHKKIRNARSMEQWSGQHIRIGYAIVRVRWSRVSCPDRICYRPGLWCSQASRARLGNPDGVDPDSSFFSTRTEILTSGILLRQHFPPGYPTSGILSWWRSTFSGCFTSDRHIRMGKEGVSTSTIRHIRIRRQRWLLLKKYYFIACN